MMPVSRRSARFVLLATVSLLAAAALHRGSAAANKMNLQSTDQQILDRSEPICRAIASDRQELRLSADYTRHHLGGVWTVTCTDASGNELAALTWDDSTGALLNLSVQARQTPGAHPVVRTSRQATASALRWLMRLGVCTGERLLQISCQSHNLSARSSYDPYWIVVCRLKTHLVTVHIDAGRDLPTFVNITHRKAP